ncbi:MAG: T9SS type A sorting domain-containing protein [Candidatus Cloacimonetes bacterium]|nr:T9SS type A sorting domain-containing protein [Candidatus Cloacimonadota bacterium]
MRKTLLLLIAWFMIVLPVLSETFAEPPSNFYEHNAGSEENPFLIANLNNLRWLSETETVWGNESLDGSVLEKFYFHQIADIDATETIHWNNGAGFSPIGFYYADHSILMGMEIYKAFYGDYDGNGFIISNLFMNTAIDSFIARNAGLFGMVRSANLLNIRLMNVDITGSANVGSIVGTIIGGSILRCSATGFVNGRDFDFIWDPENPPVLLTGTYTGGLIGYAGITEIKYCYAKVHIHSNVKYNGQTAGIAGTMSQGSINNSFFFGNFLEGTQRIGGITTGFTTFHFPDISYVIVASTSHFPVDSGGFGGNTKNSFWDTESTGVRPIFYIEQNNYGLTTTELQQTSTYINNGWDFESVWSMDPKINGGYPYLTGMIPLDHTVSTFDNIENTISLFSSIAYPNPVRGDEVMIRFNLYPSALPITKGGNNVELRIYNIRGQLVQRISDIQTKTDGNMFSWNMRNTSGQRVSPGIYFYRIISSSSSTPANYNEMKETLTGRFIILNPDK